ncbi:MAG: ubiquinol-cytochrome c reductase cytochrome b subunit [Candidatus Eremiobacteraeota bacterium]|nr:ubiquinol-cytochrome c reductase cytochrome b subunit [Candidatus Eremiobacteraeota bacterium]
MIEGFLLWIDDRLGTAHFVRHALRKAFPDHWSFMLGEINVYAFMILLATGTFLALFFDPNSAKTVYNGPYALLDGVRVSHAYRSAMALSFEVRLGLLVRQIHHWTALLFVAGIATHMARIFFTGAFRKPREINWVIGFSLFWLAIFEGFTGYSLPDDLLSGIGLRIAVAVVQSIPLIGTWLSFLLVGGVFPSKELLSRLFVMHIYVVPFTLAGLITLHLVVLWRQKHAQFPGPGRTEHNVVGSPLFPKYAVKSLALLMAVVAVTAALGALVQINPIWLWGPYDPWNAVSPAQPDWYIGWLEGALRVGPAFAAHLWHWVIPSPFWPAVLLPMLLFSVFLVWPWIDAAIRKDRASHQLLDNPRDVPWRTGAGVAVAIFVASFIAAGGDDVQARYLHINVTTIVTFYRIFILLGPLLGFFVAYAAARELRERHGVHKAMRIRLRRNLKGGFEEEPLP